MKILMFGATGMVGQGVLRECLRDAEVEQVVSIVRRAGGVRDAKLREIAHGDFFDYSDIEEELKGLDACFYCLGVTSLRISEEDYTRITYTMTMAAAETLARLTPAMTFVYVSGAGTGGNEQGRVMWTRVKSRTENALLRLPLRAYMFRPGFIEPVNGERSKTALYNFFMRAGRPLWAVLRLFPKIATTTERLGRAMLAVAKRGYPTRVLESVDINRAG